MARAGNKPKPPVTPRPARREYDREALVPEICKRLADPATTGLGAILRDMGIPRRTVDQWRADYQDIAAQFDEARDDGRDAIAHRCRATARGKREKQGGDSTGDVQRDKLIIDTDMKLLAKWDPRRYGDKVQLADADGNKLPPLQFIVQPVKAVGE